MHSDNEPIDVIEGQRFERDERVGCYLCGRVKLSRNIPVGFGMHAMVAECSDCRLAFQTPRPSTQASLAYMNWRWRSDDEYVGDRGVQTRRAMQRVAYVKPYIDRPIRLADFGAGAGAFVRAALDEGWDATGIEQSESARVRARLFYKVELRPQLENEKYDIVTLWDVIEHLRDPVSVLRLIAAHLTDDGLVLIETGNFENWQRIVDKDEWGLYLFDHQFYFSPSSIKEVLRRAGYNGFCLLSHNKRHPSTQLRSAIRSPLHSIASWYQWARAKMRWPDHGDINIMIVVARRRPGLTVR